MPKWIKFILGLLLLPVCVGAGRALARVLAATGRAELIWVAMAGGAACWLVAFLMLPKPMRLYIFGHELTHVLWTWLFGGSVRKFKINASGGHVVVSRTNFLIALSPYFFPIYVVLVTACYGLGHAIWGWPLNLPWFHLALGAAYAFHLTLTWHILQFRQSDITNHGYLFSAAIIFLGNVLVLLLGLPVLTGQLDVLTALGWWLNETGIVLTRLSHLLGGS